MSNDPNPKLELAFWKWLNSQDLTIRLAIGREPDNKTRSFSLHHGGIELSGAIDERGIDISAERDGVCWDILLSLVVVPDAVRDGFQCLACIMSERRTFVDIEGLWQNHLFGPLLGWMRRRSSKQIGCVSIPRNAQNGFVSSAQGTNPTVSLTCLMSAKNNCATS